MKESPREEREERSLRSWGTLMIVERVMMPMPMALESASWTQAGEAEGSRSRRRCL